jgi:hypothetical protein
LNQDFDKIEKMCKILKQKHPGNPENLIKILVRTISPAAGEDCFAALAMTAERLIIIKQFFY